MKVSELEGAELDYWVAKADGWEDSRQVWENRRRWQGPFRPSSLWADGGPIIERERIALLLDYGPQWYGQIIHNRDRHWGCCGPTPLIAAMRAFVASKFGNEVGE